MSWNRLAMTRRRQVDRERLLRTLTFWMRPGFVLRVLNRFQRVAGFDRAIALASSAFTALIPLAVVAGALLSHIGGKVAAPPIIDPDHLTARGAAPSSAPPPPASRTE